MSEEVQASGLDRVNQWKHIWGAGGHNWIAVPGLALKLVGALNACRFLSVEAMTLVLASMGGRVGMQLSDLSELLLDLES